MSENLVSHFMVIWYFVSCFNLSAREYQQLIFSNSLVILRCYLCWLHTLRPTLFLVPSHPPARKDLSKDGKKSDLGYEFGLHAACACMKTSCSWCVIGCQSMNRFWDKPSLDRCALVRKIVARQLEVGRSWKRNPLRLNIARVFTSAFLDPLSHC